MDFAEGNDSFGGSNEECRIVKKTFYGKDSYGTTRNLKPEFGKCTNSVVASSAKPHKELLLKDSSNLGDTSRGMDDSDKNSKRMKLSVSDVTYEETCSGNVLNPSIVQERSISSVSQPTTGSSFQRFTFREVDHSNDSVVSSCYVYKGSSEEHSIYLSCAVDGHQTKVSSLEHNDCNPLVVTKQVTSPVSQESCATKVTVASSSLVAVDSSNNKSSKKGNQEDDELFGDVSLKDTRDQLTDQVTRLMEVLGWRVEVRQRNCRTYKEKLYTSTAGKRVREFPKLWRLLGRSLFVNKNNIVVENSNKRWTDLGHFCFDLSRTLAQTDEMISDTETPNGLDHVWNILDPFVNLMFIDRKIGPLRRGTTVQAMKSIPENAKVKNNGDLCFEELDAVQKKIIPENNEQIQPFNSSLNAESAISASVENNVNRDEKLSCARISNFGKNFGEELNLDKCENNHYVRAGSDSNGASAVKLGRSYVPSIHGMDGQVDDGDLLISVMFKKKKSNHSKSSAVSKMKVRKPKHQKKAKSRGRQRNLLPRSMAKVGQQFVSGKCVLSGSRTTLSWLIDVGVIHENETILYCKNQTNDVVKKGYLTRDGIRCDCCSKMFSVSKFRLHAGANSFEACSNLFMDSGRPYLLCQLQGWSAEYSTRKNLKRPTQAETDDQSDDICGLCGDGGDLICCDNCPATFHQNCLSTQDIPEGNWYCSSCTCHICEEFSRVGSSEELKCTQCEHKYHPACLREKNVEGVAISDAWFCGKKCQEIYSGLQSRIGVVEPLSNDYSSTLLKCVHDDEKSHFQRWLQFKAECNTRLAVALTIMEECFASMVDPKTGINMIPHMLYNFGSSLPRLDFHRFYSVILEKNDVVLCVASLRIHGSSVAEIPLVATCSKYRRQGMCLLLIGAIEEMLRVHKIEVIVISAVSELVPTWVNGFGFQLVEDDEKASFKALNLVVLPGTFLLKKTLLESHQTEQITSHALSPSVLPETDEPAQLKSIPKARHQSSCFSLSAEPGTKNIPINTQVQKTGGDPNSRIVVN